MSIHEPTFDEILVTGTVSNVSKTIIREIEKLKIALSGFKIIKFYLVESDSTDETIKKLKILKSTSNNFDYISLGRLKSKIPDRLERIRFCRNKYIDFIRANSKNCPTYILVADLDGMNTALKSKGVLSCFSRLDWDVVTANQTFGYYDILALRKDGWQENDWTEELKLMKDQLVWSEIHGCRIISKIRNYFVLTKLKQRILFAKMRRINSRSEWIKVDSAFGGLAIYKKEVFLNFDYIKEFHTIETDHVSLNRKIVRNGGNIYINPGLINSHLNEYNLSRILIFRLIREFVWNNKLIYIPFQRYFKGLLSKIVYRK